MNIRMLIAASLTAMSFQAAAQTVTLKVAHFLPAVAPAQQKVLQPWCDALNKESRGRIACQIYPSMQLGGTPPQLVDQVRNGVADVVWTAPGYSAGRFPVIEALELPFVVTDAHTGSLAAWSFYEQHAQKEFDAFKVLAVHVDGGMALHTSKRNIQGMSDITGLKLRASGRMAAKTLAALGGSPVAMPPAQMTEAISKGVVDGAMGAWELVSPTKLDEVSRFHAEPASGMPYPATTVLTMLMNRQKYDALPADLKAIIDRYSGPPLVAEFGRVWEEEAAASRAKVKSRGNTIHQFSTAEFDAMKRATAPVEADWIKSMNDRGLDGSALAEAARDLAARK
ncbi:TRAP transporter substrate-binding protein [Parazoarcus communis]|nr:TRAP transporter substrate-binding protein [Parazoarcus communis]